MMLIKMWTPRFLKLIFFNLTLLIFLLAWKIQNHILINIDVGWLLEASKRMLAGGTYTKDFFENNPPWILYFYIPVNLLAKFFSFDSFVAIKVYVFIVAIQSLFVSRYLLNRILSSSEHLLVDLCLLTLAYLFILFPLGEFGQREHFLFILTTPYFLLMVLHVQNRTIPRWVTVFIGVFAGAGFILKPYFLMPLLLVELYYWWQQKKLNLRPETTSILLLIFIYSSLIVLRHADYLFLIIPYAVRWCYTGTQRSWMILIDNPLVVYSMFSVFFALITFPINRYRDLTITLLLALLGFLFSYFIQRVDYVYRVLPAFSTAILLMIVLFYLYITTPKKSISTQVLMSIWLASFVFFLIPYLIPCINYWSISLILIMMLIWIFLGSQKNNIGVIFSVLLILYFPSYLIIHRYTFYKDQKLSFQPLIHFINKNMSHRTVYFFNTDLFYTISLLSCTQEAKSAGRFSGFWQLPGLIKQSYLSLDLKKILQLKKDKKLLVDMISEDLTVKHPNFVFIDTLPHKNSLFFDIKPPNATFKGDFIPFDYLAYFGDNSNFNKAWQPYHFKKTISGYSLDRELLYRFDLYERT